MSRSPERLRDYPWASRVERVQADATDPEASRRALDRIEVAYYLIHALGSGRRFEEADRRAARTFAAAAAAAASGALSWAAWLEAVPFPRIALRGEVGQVLLDSPVPAAVLRAAIILGSGSASLRCFATSPSVCR